MASLPTIIKSFNNPETETGWPYFTTVISGIITLLAVRSYTFANIGFTIYLIIVCVVISVLVQFRLGKIIKSFVRLKDEPDKVV